MICLIISHHHHYHHHHPLTLCLANDNWMAAKREMGMDLREEDEEGVEEVVEVIMEDEDGVGLDVSEDSSPDVIANRLSTVIQAPSFASPGPLARSVPYGYHLGS